MSLPEFESQYLMVPVLVLVLVVSRSNVAWIAHLNLWILQYLGTSSAVYSYIQIHMPTIIIILGIKIVTNYYFLGNIILENIWTIRYLFKLWNHWSFCIIASRHMLHKTFCQHLTVEFLKYVFIFDVLEYNHLKELGNKILIMCNID